ncbi:MAG: aminomethyltransferase family protein, partial [Desulfobacteraceae bacterium]|nr:aminomethyltransferase family protein [Desulfobacteraceae bacterium]
EQALHVYDTIVEAGKEFNLSHAGLKALGSLRMEKGYRDYGHDMDNTDDPYETGLGFTIKLDKASDFIGKQACIKKKAEGPLKRRLAQVLVKDPDPLLYHAEIITRDGKNMGYVRSGSYCYTLGGAVGLFMLEPDEIIDEAFISKGKWEINIAGKVYPAEVSIKPLYDPENKKIKC